MKNERKRLVLVEFLELVRCLEDCWPLTNIGINIRINTYWNKLWILQANQREINVGINIWISTYWNKHITVHVKICLPAWLLGEPLEWTGKKTQGSMLVPLWPLWHRLHSVVSADGAFVWWSRVALIVEVSKFGWNSNACITASSSIPFYVIYTYQNDYINAYIHRCPSVYDSLFCTPKSGRGEVGGGGGGGAGEGGSYTQKSSNIL